MSMLSRSLVRLVWSYFEAEEESFLARELRIGDKRCTLQQIANFAARTGWIDVIVRLRTCANWRKAFPLAVAYDHIGIARVLLRWGYDDSLGAAKLSARNGFLRGVQWAISQEKQLKLSEIISAAAEGDRPGNCEVLKFLHFAATSVGYPGEHIARIAVESAAEHGCVQTLQYILSEWNVSDRVRNSSIYAAARGGSIAVFDILGFTNKFTNKFTSAHSPNDITLVFAIAAGKGHLELIKHIIIARQVEPEYDDMFWEAASNNHLTIMEWARSKAEIDLNEEIAIADVVLLNDAALSLQYLKRSGAVRVDQVQLNKWLVWAASSDALDCIRLLVQWGATSINAAFIEAAKEQSVAALKLLKELGATAISEAHAHAEDRVLHSFEAAEKCDGINSPEFDKVHRAGLKYMAIFEQWEGKDHLSDNE